MTNTVRPEPVEGLSFAAPEEREGASTSSARTGEETASASASSTFVNIGERTNVTGSARFKKLVMAGDYAAATRACSTPNMR
jgi:cobalamin-dependent methionine synthase I